MSNNAAYSGGLGKVDVTEASGFIGGHVCKALAEAGFAPVQFSRSPAGPRHEWRLDADMEGSALCLVGADAAVHLAAYFQMKYEYYGQVKQYREENSTQALGLLRVAKLVGIRHFIHASTAANIYTISSRGERKFIDYSTEGNLC